MDIKELQEQKQQLEWAITSAIGKIVDKFTKDVGLSPSMISVNMEEVTSIGDKSKQYVVGNTYVNLSI